MNIEFTWVHFTILFLTVALIGFGAALWLRHKKRRELQRVAGAAAAWLKEFPELEPKFVEFEGERVHYIQTGRGPDLVLLHGIGASLFIWRFIIKRLAQHYRVTALDIPGFGRSSKNPSADYGLDAQRRRLTLFLETLKIHRSYLIGSSMGGAIALWMAHEEPQRYPKVAALAPATSPELIPKGLSKIAVYAPLPQKLLNRKTMKLILGYVVAKRELITPETIDAYLEPYLDEGTSVRTFLGALQLLGDRRMPNCFRGSRSEVLIIQGEKDRLVTLRSIYRLTKVLHSAELVISPSGGHHIMEDEPEWTADELLRFFES